MLGPWLRLAVVIIGIWVAIAPLPAVAATLVVTRQDDPLPDGCDSGVDCSLREAIIAANVAQDPDTIQLGSFVYTLSIPGRDEDAAATGDLDITSPITILSQNATVVEAGSSSALGVDRVLDVVSGSLSINGFTVRHGNPGESNGGGMRIAPGASLTVDLGTVTANQAGHNGGGISNNGALVMTNTTVSSNGTATGGTAEQVGGGIATFSGGSMSLTNVVVSGNTAGRQGGGIHNSATGSTITGGSITGNSTPTGTTLGTRDGGGIFNSSPGSLTISGASITNNTAGRDGGGIANSGTLTINTGTTITGNATTTPDPADPNVNNHDGGGIRNFTTGVLTISDSSISNNTAFRSGGGMTAAGQAELTNTTVTLNHAGNSGGGLNNFSSVVSGVQSKLKITGGSVSQNTAGLSGGGVIGSSAVEISGTTISNNQAGTTGLASGGGAAVFVSTTPGVTTELTMTGATVSGNSASGSGGGVAGTGRLTISNSTITGNQAGTTGTGNGGGVAGFASSDAAQTTQLELTNVTVTNNTATGGSGGGISAFGANLTVTGGTIQNNSTNFDGAGIAKGTGTSGAISHTSEATISSNALIKDNHGTTASSDGGGIANVAGPLEIRDSIVEDNDVLGFGGGVGNFNGGVTTVFNTTIRNNTAGQGGGGITQGSTGSPSITLTDTTVSGNAATTSTGGGLTAGGGTVTLLRATFSGNSAGTGGGGLFLSTGTTTSVTNGTIQSNTAGQSGGGLNNGGTATLTDSTVAGNQATSFAGGLNNVGSLTLNRVTVSGNSSLTNGGGGISNSATGTLNVTDSTFHLNATQVNGGGIIADSDGTLTLIRTTFSQNSAVGTGGGLGFGGSRPGGTGTLTNVTFSANAAGASGGAIVLGGPTLTATNVTIQGNQASQARAIHAQSGVMNLRNTILASSAGGNCLGAVTTQGNNLEFPGNTCGLNPGLGDLPNADPQLGALANNGGTTLTHALHGNSPAVDAGTNTNCPGTDQRNLARPNDGNGDGVNTCDIGAVEATVFALTVNKTGSGASTGTVTGSGINCGPVCQRTYASGRIVPLTPANTGATFLGWSGACNGSGACQPTIDSAKTVTAEFQRINVGVVVSEPNPQPQTPFLTATLSARSGCGPIVQIQFGVTGQPFDNAVVSITTPAGAPPPSSSGFPYTPPPNTTTVTLRIQRVAQAGGATVKPIIFRDGCGDWPTFVGGGPNAFQ